MNMPETDLSYRPTSYWPANEAPADGVVLADVVLESVLGDVISVVAEATEEGQIRLEIRNDEGATVCTAEPSTVARPLSLGELIALIDTADLGETMERGLVYGLLAMNSLVGSGNPSDADFIGVTSEVYPGLAEHYDRQVLAWVMGDRPSDDA